MRILLRKLLFGKVVKISAYITKSISQNGYDRSSLNIPGEG